jgi:hypothetical protein
MYTALTFGVMLFRLPCLAQVPKASSSGPELTAGMGVYTVNPQDVVDWVNSITSGGDRVPSFNTAVEFFLLAGLRVSPDLRLKLDYGMMLTSFNREGQFGPAEFTIIVHMPSLLLEYVLADEGLYSLKAGVGGGYHFGSVDQKYVFIDTRYRSSGAGIVLQLEGNTALSEQLFAYLGVCARWEILGDLQSDRGAAPGGAGLADMPTLQMFGLGARLGLSFFF